MLERALPYLYQEDQAAQKRAQIMAEGLEKLAKSVIQRRK
jgi:hypothetical protein